MKRGPNQVQIPTSLSMQSAMLLAQDLSTKSGDAFFEVVKLLSFREIAVLSAVARKRYPAVAAKLRSNVAAEKVWGGYLEALHQLDPNVPASPASDVTDKGSWYYATAMNAAKAIYQLQSEEIAYLRQRHPHHELLSQMNTADIDAKDVNMAVLLARHLQLDELNEALIRTRIDEQSTRLNLLKLGITRIPEQLLNDSKLRQYWHSLTSLTCESNALRILPDSIGDLVALESLNCTFNQLCELPNTFGNLVALESLWLHKNHLHKLPSSFEKLKGLKILNLSHNHFCELPNYLWKKFGEDSCKQILAAQISPLSEPRIFIPKFAVISAQRKDERDEKSKVTTEPAESARDNPQQVKRKRP